jgi:signal transduction histidine kinase
VSRPARYLKPSRTLAFLARSVAHATIQPSVRPSSTEKHLDTAYLFEGDVPTGIRGDVTRLRQIIVNLLANAVKFTGQGEVVHELGCNQPRRVTACGKPPTPVMGRTTRLHSDIGPSR